MIKFFKKKEPFTLNDTELPSLKDLENNKNNDSILNQNVNSGGLIKGSETFNESDGPSNINYEDNVNNQNNNFEFGNEKLNQPISNFGNNQNFQNTNNIDTNLKLIQSELENLQVKFKLLENNMTEIKNFLSIIYNMIFSEMSDSGKERFNKDKIMETLNRKIK